MLERKWVVGWLDWESSDTAIFTNSSTSGFKVIDEIPSFIMCVSFYLDLQIAYIGVIYGRVQFDPCYKGHLYKVRVCSKGGQWWRCCPLHILFTRDNEFSWFHHRFCTFQSYFHIFLFTLAHWHIVQRFGEDWASSYLEFLLHDFIIISFVYSWLFAMILD